MNRYPIQKGVPLPAPRAGGWKQRNAFPLKQMQPGDMFEVDEAEYYRVRGALNSYRTIRPGAKFVTRGYNGGFGVWCIENETVQRKRPGPKPK